MNTMADQPAQDVFWFYEYFLLPKPTGKKATNLMELLQHLREMAEPVLAYHFWQSRLATTRTLVEYPNDFALWAATALHDDQLAEKLTSVDPVSYNNLTQVREAMVDLLEDYLWESPHNLQVRPGFELYFCEAAAVIMRSGIAALTLRDFCTALETIGLDSLYYHFIESRRRLPNDSKDDFSHWIDSNFALPDLVSAIRGIDVYFYTLPEVRDTLVSLIKRYLGDAGESAK